MKSFISVLLLFITVFTANADIIKANVLATGLTCSLCSKATFNQLNSIPEVAKIDVDVNNTSFILEFKKGTSINPEVIKQKIEDAGFSVGKLELTIEKEDVSNQFSIGNYTFSIVNAKKVSTKIFTIKILNQGFITPKEYKALIKGKPHLASKNKKANAYFVEVL